MHGIGRRLAARGLAAIVVALVALGGALASPASSARAATLSPWTGGIDLYRSGVFTTQKTWLWCTAADVQIIRNIVDHTADHSRSSQQRYFDAMRAHNRYAIPVSDGVDPAGWTYGLQHFVDARYRLVASGSFDAALRSAVTSLRRTNLPVGITVSHGNHAWILTGFTATADPAATSRFTVTSVRVVGPLWGLQSRSYGYDMRPDTKLTARQFAGFFTPWHYARIRMAWEGRWVSVQPTGGSSTTTAQIASPPSPRPGIPSSIARPPSPSADASASAGTAGGAGAAGTPLTTSSFVVAGAAPVTQPGEPGGPAAAAALWILVAALTIAAAVTLGFVRASRANRPAARRPRPRSGSAAAPR